MPTWCSENCQIKRKTLPEGPAGSRREVDGRQSGDLGGPSRVCEVFANRKISFPFCSRVNATNCHLFPCGFQFEKLRVGAQAVGFWCAFPVVTRSKPGRKTALAISHCARAADPREGFLSAGVGGDTSRKQTIDARGAPSFRGNGSRGSVANFRPNVIEVPGIEAIRSHASRFQLAEPSTRTSSRSGPCGSKSASSYKCFASLERRSSRD